MSKRSKSAPDHKASAPAQPARRALPARADLASRGFVLMGLALVAIAAVLRALWLGRPSYWIDEINIIRDAMNPESMADIFRIELERFQTYRGVPFPLYVLRVFLKTLGFTGPYPGPLPPEWAPRLLSLSAGLCAIPIFGALGRDLANRRVGVWAMFLCAFSVFHAWYCRDTRVYGLMITLLAGTLWTGLHIVKEPAFSRHWWGWAAAYAVFASAYLQSSLNTIFFLLPWSGLLLLASMLRMGTRNRFAAGRRALGLLPPLVLPFLLFAPFLIRLFGYNIHGQVDDKVVILSWRILPSLFGRMGWGEAWYALLPFSTLAAWGGVSFACEWRANRASLGILISLQGLAVLVLQSAAQWLSDSAFEVRYYMGLFPILLLLAAKGLEQFSELKIWRRIKGPAFVRGVAVVLIAGWALPNLWLLVHVRCQGFCNYKAIAEWINTHVSAGGAYSFYNIYEMRGVPMTYATPERTATSVAVWSGAEQYRRTQPALRAVEFFGTFPEIPFIEIAPLDVLRPDKADAFIPRETLFARQEWIDDPAFEKLVKLQTCPLGSVQVYGDIVQRILISWNRPDDLPELAQKLKRVFYHQWGPEWQYGRDQQARHWMISAAGGTLALGNVAGSVQTADMVVKVLSPGGCRLSVSAPVSDGDAARSFDLEAGMFSEITVRRLAIKPGSNKIGLRAMRAGSEARQPGLFVNDIRLLPASTQ